ncbi:MAG: flagellar biosynthesis anti-sigma factor FlgM [Candidatus Eremiobacterota bacterium]
MHISGDYSNLKPVYRPAQPGPTVTPSPTRVGRTEALVSPEALERLQAARAVEAAPSLQASRVEEIRQRMQRGEYRVDLDALAERLARVLGP